MIRIVVDTNVFISAIIFGGFPLEFLALAFAGRFQLITSIVLLDELEEKLRGKFKWSSSRVNGTRDELEAIADIVSPLNNITVVARDPDDDRVLECAIAGNADYIVTGDRHLLELGSYNGIRILTVRQFMDLLTPAS